MHSMKKYTSQKLSQLYFQTPGGPYIKLESILAVPFCLLNSHFEYYSCKQN